MASTGGYDFAPAVLDGRELWAPGAFPDVYSRGNAFGLIPSKIAAGTDFSVTVPFGVYWDVKTLTGQLVTAVAAATRQVGFVVKDQTGTVMYQYNMTGGQAASLTVVYTFSEDSSVAPTAAAAASNVLLMPMPKAWIPPGWSIGTSTVAIQAADQWSALGLYVQEWLPPQGE